MFISNALAVKSIVISGSNILPELSVMGYLSTNNGSHRSAVNNGFPPNTWVQHYPISGSNIYAGVFIIIMWWNL